MLKLILHAHADQLTQSSRLIRRAYSKLVLANRRLTRKRSRSFFRQRPTNGPTCQQYSTGRTNSDRTVISYLTDVEGDASYLDRYVRQSRVLRFVPVEPRWGDDDSTASLFEGDFSSCRYFPYDHCIDFRCHDDDDNNNNTMLIYGGDIWDKGGSDLYVVRQLLDLKRRHSDRVHLIMGNRDINKMRIGQEMGLYSEEETNNKEEPELPKHDGVYWIRNWHLRNGGDPNDESLVPPQTSAVERLKWMLARTMGSPKAFELRRAELQREQQQAQYNSSSQPVSDEQVVESYRKSCHPSTGEMGNYLSNASLALRMGELLVLHGALPLTGPVLEKAVEQQQDPAEFWKDTSFARPWENSEAVASKSTTTTSNQAIKDWMESLNQFTKTSIESWKADFQNQATRKLWALEGGYPGGYHNLMQYGMGWTPDGLRNPTIVYSSWSVDGMPKRFYPDNNKQKDQMFARLVK